MNGDGWIDAALRGARPQVMAALLRRLRDLDAAEEAFQEACLRALNAWPTQGPPRDPASWLFFVGRNAALDGLRRRRKEEPLPSEEAFSNLNDAEAELTQELERGRYRDDILRLLFICCHPDLPATGQIALALRVVCGLSVSEVARAFLVQESAMEQRITRAKRSVAAADVPFDPRGPTERDERRSAVATVIYLMFNEGYAATGGAARVKEALCDEAIRLARLLIGLFPSEPEVLGLTALLLLQHSRHHARLDAEGVIVLLEDQDRSRWDREAIAEGLTLLDKAVRHRQPGPYQVQAAIAAMHARAATAEATDWPAIDALYATLQRLTPSPVVTLNRAVAVSKVRGAEAALEMIEPLAHALGGYFYFFGLRGSLLSRLGRHEEAREAFDRAIALAGSPAEAAHIRTQIERLRGVTSATTRFRKSVSRLSDRGGLVRPTGKDGADMNEQKQLPGKFIWFELRTSDPKKAQAFYADVLGWSVRSFPMNGGDGSSTYDMIYSSDTMIGGYAAPEKGGTTRWVSCVSVPDVDEAARAAIRAKGRLVEGPLDVPGAGRLARILDPQGAEVCLFKKTTDDPVDVAWTPHGGWVWNELHTPSPEEALAFYARVVGFTHKALSMGPQGDYFVVSRGGVDRGGVMPDPCPEGPPAWLPYVSVTDVDAALDRAKRAGGQILFGPVEIPGVGRLGTLQDPTGGRLAVMKPNPRA